LIEITRETQQEVLTIFIYYSYKYIIFYASFNLFYPKLHIFTIKQYIIVIFFDVIVLKLLLSFILYDCDYILSNTISCNILCNHGHISLHKNNIKYKLGKIKKIKYRNSEYTIILIL